MTITELGHFIKPALTLLLLPPVSPMLILAIGALLALRQRRRAGGWVLLVGFVVLWLSMSEGVGQLLIRHLLKAPPALDRQAITSLREESKKTGDVAVLVLGAGIRGYVPEYLGPSLQPLTLERLRYGIWLSRQLDAPVGFTGGIGWGARSTRYPEAFVVDRVAREEFGVQLRWAEARARDTRENALFTLPILQTSGVRKLVLVTHVEHMPRALNAFQEVAKSRNADMEIVAAPAGLVADGMSEVLDWCPGVEGFSQVRYALYEWLGQLAGH